jgi:ComEC/Rec2-related protein
MWWAAFLVSGAFLPAPNFLYMVPLGVFLVCSIVALVWSGDRAGGLAAARSGIALRYRNGAAGFVIAPPMADGAIRFMVVTSAGVLIWMGAGLAREVTEIRQMERHGPQGSPYGGVERSGLPTLFGKSSQRVTAALRSTLLASLDDGRLTEPGRALLGALLLARRSELDPRFRERYEYLGIAHFLALSGLHLGILSVALIRLLCVFRLPKTLRGVLLLVLLGAYAAVAGFPPSLLRALALLAALLIERRIGCKSGLFGTLVRSGFIIVILASSIIFNPGFQLSFCAVCAIALIGIPTMRLCDRFLPAGAAGRMCRIVLYPVIVTCSVQLFALPLVLHYFGRISFAAPLMNLMIVLPVTALLYSGLVYLFCPVPLVRAAIAVPVNCLSDLLWRLPERFSHTPHPALYAGSMSAPLYGAGILLLIISLNGRRRKQLAFAAAVLLLIGSRWSVGARESVPGRPFERVPAPRSGERYRCPPGEPLLLLSGGCTLILDGRIGYGEARRIVRCIWMAGRGDIGRLVLCAGGSHGGGGVLYLLERIRVRELVASPYLLRSDRLLVTCAERAGVRVRAIGCEDFIPADGYLLHIRGPVYPPPPGHSLTAREAALRCVVLPRGGNDTPALCIFRCPRGS